MLKDKVALVTGGGAGIGRAASLIFAGYGARVVVADIDADTAAAVADEIRAKGGDAISVAADMTREADVERMIDQTSRAFGRLDCAFNNAGVANAFAPTTELTAAHWDQTLGLDLIGVWLCIKHEIPLMLKTGGGAIVNTASNAGKFAVPTLAPYGAAKAGLISLTQTVAVEYGGRGIRANAICPGTIDTAPIQAAKAAGVDFTTMFNVPLGRIGLPEEVAELAAWLASPLSSFVTGQAISIDGGQSATQ